ncbi:MAG: response regulator [Armatimonadetes bacterium]|nr:response regulator [Armatimonadota bacterium]
MGSTAPAVRPCALVVEDDKDTAEMLHLLISGALGYSVIHAATAEEGWQLLQRHGADLLITDHCFTHAAMTGLDLAARAKAAYPTLPVVMISGDPPEEAARICDQVYLKPVDPGALLDTITRLVETTPAAHPLTPDSPPFPPFLLSAVATGRSGR